MVTANTHTHSLTYTDTRLHMHPLAHPPTHTHTPKIWGKGGGKGDSTGIHSIRLEITTLIENRKMEREKNEKQQLLSLYVLLTSEFTHNKFQKVC